MRAIFDAQDQHRQKISELAVARRGIIGELLNQDLSKAEIARQLGITRARMSQLTTEVAANT
jgi:DNA-directed RNA polymerase specialized sigma subunit